MLATPRIGTLPRTTWFTPGDVRLALGLGQAGGLTTGATVMVTSGVSEGRTGRVGRTMVAVAVGVMVDGGGVAVRVGATSGPDVAVGVGSGGRFRVGKK